MSSWRDLPPVTEPVTVPPQPSQTLLGHFDNCHRAAYLYLLTDKGAGSHQMNRGSAFHETVARLTNLLIEQEERTVPPDLAKAVLAEVFAEHPEWVMSAKERDACRFMVNHWAEGSFFDPANIVAIEELLTVEIGGRKIRCKPDLIEQSGHYLDITDYKTSFAMPSAEEFAGTSEEDPRGFAGDFQTMLYAVAVAFGQTAEGISYGQGVERFRLFQRFPRYLREEGIAYKEAIVTRDALTDFRADIEAQLAQLDRCAETGKWEAVPSTHCYKCPAELECPLPAHVRGQTAEGPITTLEEAQAQAELWERERTMPEKRKARIKAFCAEREVDCVPIGTDLELRFVFTESERVKNMVDLQLGIERAIEYGEAFDWNKYVMRTQSTRFERRRVKEEAQ